MAKGFAKIPREKRFVLANATVPAVLTDGYAATPDKDGLVGADITVRNGLIERIDPPGRRTTLPKLNLDRGMVWPCFVDMHTHIDKGHIWPRRPNPDGTFAGALAAVKNDRERHWRRDDVERRMDFALRSAWAHGTALLRTHLDSAGGQYKITWPLFAEMRERWAGRIDLQGVTIFGIEAFLDNDYADAIVRAVAEHRGVLGAVTYMIPELDRAVELMMHRAANNGLDLDFHVDETGDPDAHSLRVIADAALRTDFPGRIVVGHCCSLAQQPDAEAEATMDRVAEAGLSVVSLPMCNMYLQDRVPAGEPARTPRWRGVTLLRELAERGVPVAVASDNTRDPFYAYGDLDMVEVFREAVRIVHLDHPLAGWARVVARGPAEIIGRPDRCVIAAVGPADLVLFSARTFSEFLSRPQADRTVLRWGKPIDRTLPDYRELDDIMKAVS
ncbi:cytosine deaminase [soil metagenome]